MLLYPSFCYKCGVLSRTVSEMVCVFESHGALIKVQILFQKVLGILTFFGEKISKIEYVKIRNSCKIFSFHLDEIHVQVCSYIHTHTCFGHKFQWAFHINHNLITNVFTVRQIPGHRLIGHTHKPQLNILLAYIFQLELDITWLNVLIDFASGSVQIVNPREVQGCTKRFSFCAARTSFG